MREKKKKQDPHKSSGAVHSLPHYNTQPVPSVCEEYRRSSGKQTTKLSFSARTILLGFGGNYWRSGRFFFLPKIDSTMFRKVPASFWKQNDDHNKLRQTDNQSYDGRGVRSGTIILGNGNNTLQHIKPTRAQSRRIHDPSLIRVHRTRPIANSILGKGGVPVLIHKRIQSQYFSIWLTSFLLPWL